MGDMGDIFNTMREASQEKRAANRMSSRELLEKHNIQFEVKNAGVHLIVDGRIDFWPGTGLWVVRGSKGKQRGVKKLLSFLAGQS